MARGVWSKEEHDRFLEALQRFPKGPWKAVAAHVGSRTARQVQTHAQKYHEKVARRLRGLRKERKRVRQPEHRIDSEMIEICEELKRDHALLATRSAPEASSKLRSSSVDDTEGNDEFVASPESPSFDECIDFLMTFLDSLPTDWTEAKSTTCDVE
ncbi:hypothetical protein PINS_up015325 [Pythium insidiosum]|nr:hypothetical protein PINS_up015325 [Pythium insidiosum]